MIPLGDDDDMVQVIEVEEFGSLFGRVQLVGDFFAVLTPRSFLTRQTDPASLSAFVVNESGNIRHFGFVADLVLITSNNPWIARLAISDVTRAILDARVVCRVAAERKAQLEILGSAILPNQERISVGFVLRGRLSVDDAVLDRPKSRVAVPTREVFPVKNGLHARRFRWSLLDLLSHGGKGTETNRQSDQTASRHY